MKRGRGRPRKGEEVNVEISDAVVASVLGAHPAGATLETIAEAVGVGRGTVFGWEASALRSFRARAKFAGLEMPEPRHSTCITDGGEGGVYRGLEGPAYERPGRERAARLAEAMATAPDTARMMAELDAASDRAVRVSLLLGAMIEDARWCEAWGEDAAE